MLPIAGVLFFLAIVLWVVDFSTGENFKLKWYVRILIFLAAILIVYNCCGT